MTRFNLKNKLDKGQKNYICCQLHHWVNLMINRSSLNMGTKIKIIKKQLIIAQLSLPSIQLPNNHLFPAYKRVELLVISKLKEIYKMSEMRHSVKKRSDSKKKKLIVKKEPQFWDKIINNNKWRLQSKIITKILYRVNINLKIKGIWNREKKYNMIIANRVILNKIKKLILLPILQDFRSLISL